MTKSLDQNAYDELTKDELFDMAEGHIRSIRFNKDDTVTVTTTGTDVWFTEPTLEKALEKLIIHKKIRE